MKSPSERQWMKMSTHGKKEFLSHHNFDKKLSTSQWEVLPDEVKTKFKANPVLIRENNASALMHNVFN